MRMNAKCTRGPTLDSQQEQGDRITAGTGSHGPDRSTARQHPTSLECSIVGAIYVPAVNPETCTLVRSNVDNKHIIIASVDIALQSLSQKHYFTQIEK